MYQKIFITSLVFSLSLVSSAQIFAGGSCQIENGPIPELAQYTRTVDARIDTLIAESRRS